MKNLNGLFALLIIFSLVLLGCAKENKEELAQFDNTTISMDDDGSATARKSRPFKGTVVYDFVPESELTCDCTTPGSSEGGPYVGSGNITHMGNVYADNVPCFIVTNVIPDGQGGFIPTQFHIPNQCGTLVAANGDELYLDVPSYNLDIDPVCFCTFNGTVEVTINGGTGRFSDASGTATSVISQDIATSVVTTSFDGTIDY